MVPDVLAPQLSPVPMHCPAKQQAPPPQALPAQQGSFALPQLTQRPAPPQIDPAAEQTPTERPVLGSMGLDPAAGAQQGSPTPPQWPQPPPKHAGPAAVQADPLQQVWPGPPQPPQDPAAQMASTGAQLPI